MVLEGRLRNINSRRRSRSELIFESVRRYHAITSDHLISSQSLNLGGRRGTTDDIATIPFHPSLSSDALRESPNPIPVHSLMLSSYIFFFLPLLLARHTIWVSFSLPLLGHHAFQLHSGFCCEPPRSSHGLCRKYSEVPYSILSQGLGSFSRFLLSRSSSHRHKGR